MKLISCLVAGLFIASPVLADNVLKPGGSADGWTLDKAENVTDGGTGTFRMKNENNKSSAMISSPAVEFAQGTTACITVTYRTAVTDSGQDRGTWVAVFCKEQSSPDSALKGYILPPTDGWATEKIVIPLANASTINFQVRLQERTGVIDVKEVAIAEATQENSARVWNFESGNGSLKVQNGAVKVSPDGFKYSELELKADSGMARLTSPMLSIQPGKPLELSAIYQTSIDGSAQDVGAWIHVSWFNAQGAPAGNSALVFGNAGIWQTQSFSLNPPEKAEFVTFQIRLQQRKGTLDLREIRLTPAKPAAVTDAAKAN